MLTGRYSHTSVVDDQGRPAGGSAYGTGIAIEWQNGPLGELGSPDREEPNGAFVEDVIAICRERIEFYQSTEFACRENALAITKLEEASHWLQARTARRTYEGSEGTLTPDLPKHPSTPVDVAQVLSGAVEPTSTLGTAVTRGS